MKYLLISAVAALLIPSDALAWGREGHAIVADIAEAQLTPQALHNVRLLLATDGAHHLADVSNWADEIKKSNLPGAPSHSMRIPLDVSSKQVAAAFQASCPGGFCAVAAIQRYRQALSDKTMSVFDREIALKFVVHLVADIHQPLHTIPSAYSRFHVIFDGDDTNMHHVWDSGIIGDERSTAIQIAQRLLKAPPQALPEVVDPLSWAMESHDIVRKVIYDTVKITDPQPHVLPADYSAKMWPVVARRLRLAGVRLASILNNAASQ
jgi:hypothetical protein